ncbi:unknown [Bacteroides sp. CAG:633]|nr:unknown [Bacteroides sp. CAG:633]
MEMEKFYVAPEVEVLEVEVEKGFAGSGDGEDAPF